MYILIVARGYPSERYKMNGIFEFGSSKALAKAGHKVIYAAQMWGLLDTNDNGDLKVLKRMEYKLKR